MNRYARYAIYYAPERGSALATLGAQWLGWDADGASDVAHLPVDGLQASLSKIAKTPRKYGFHGTLKPPFRLAQGARIDDLDDALTRFAADRAPFSMGRMRVASLGKFVAVVPVDAPSDLRELASDCVAHFDEFRAPLREAELEKRRHGGLSPRQDALLLEWGYPYVMEEFRFHLTLSGALDDGHSADVAGAASEVFSDALNEDIQVRDICLFAERDDGRFQIIKRYALGKT